MAKIDVRLNEENKRYASVEDLALWLHRIAADIDAQAMGAPAGCNETRAYLYGELCALKLIARQVDTLLPKQPPTGGTQGAQEHAVTPSASAAKEN